MLFGQLKMYLQACKNPHVYSQTVTHTHSFSSPECHHLSQAFKSDLGPFRKAIRKESFSGTQQMKSGLILFIFITRPQKVIGAKSWVCSAQWMFTAFSDIRWSSEQPAVEWRQVQTEHRAFIWKGFCVHRLPLC